MTENYFCVLPADMLNAPALVPGTTEDSRVGLEVTTKRAYFKYAITPTRYQTAPGVDFNPYPCPFILRMILYHRKKSPNDAPQVSQMTDSATCDFFEEGGDVEGWSGGIVDLTKRLTTIHMCTTNTGISKLVNKLSTQQQVVFYQQVILQIMTLVTSTTE